MNEREIWILIAGLAGGINVGGILAVGAPIFFVGLGLAIIGLTLLLSCTEREERGTND